MAADPIVAYRKAHKAFIDVQAELDDVERRYQEAIDAQASVFLDVARLDACPKCAAFEGKPCTFSGIPSMFRVHAERDTRARNRLHSLGMFP